MADFRKKKKYRLSPLTVTLMLALLIAGCIVTAALVTEKLGILPVGGAVSSGGGSSQPASNEPEPPPAPVSARFLAVGDNLIHPALYQQAKQRGGEAGYDFQFAYESVEPLLGLADIASINQETVMVKELESAGYPTFNSPTALGDHMVNIGFDVFNLANNHIYDKTTSALGAGALTSYLNYWGNFPDALTIGLYRDSEDTAKIRLLKKNGITFSFIGLTESTNGLPRPKDTETVLVMASDEDTIRAQIESAKAQSDVVVVNAHWGVEYTNEPSTAQTELAQKMVDWGADIIVGHHPHVIQPVTYLTREDGTSGIVAYSLGNFISAQDRPYRMVGGALDITVTKDPVNGEVSISGARFIPMITQYEGDCQNVRVYPYDLYTEDLAAAHGLRGGGAQFSMEFIDKVVSDVIPTEFLTLYTEEYTSAAPSACRAGTLSDEESTGGVDSGEENPASEDGEPASS